jgi:fucose 4-O-acetylase-like acetyltransferase
MATIAEKPSEVKPPARERIEWIDYAKGLGIFLVVIGHVLRGLPQSGVISKGTAYWFVDSWIYSFHMPLFFFISGIFIDRQAARPAGTFFSDKFGTIIYPYFVWSIIQTLIQQPLLRYTNHPTEANQLIRILYEPIMQFWFLYTLFLASVSYYLLKRLRLGPLGITAVFLAFWSTQAFFEIGSSWFLIAFRKYGVIFALGAVFQRFSGIERVNKLSTPILGLIAGLGYLLVTLAIVFAWTPKPFALVHLLTSLSGTAATIALGTLLSRVGNLDFLRTWGFYSLEIYLTHTIASAGIRIVLLKLAGIREPSVHFVLGTLGGIYASLLLVWFTKKYNLGFLFRLKLPSRT